MFQLKLQDQQPRSYRDGQSLSFSHQKPLRGMVTSSLCTFLSPLMNALLESTLCTFVFIICFTCCHIGPFTKDITLPHLRVIETIMINIFLAIYS